jgi:hypothetical protein
MSEDTPHSIFHPLTPPVGEPLQIFERTVFKRTTYPDKFRGRIYQFFVQFSWRRVHWVSKKFREWFTFLRVLQWLPLNGITDNGINWLIESNLLTNPKLLYLIPKVGRKLILLLLSFRPVVLNLF